MADVLRFRGLSTAEINTTTVNDREIVIDIETREIVFGARGSLYRVGESGGGIEEAPFDGQLYARQSGTWSVVTGGGSSNVS